MFSKELRCMMYGFGDDQNPYTESVDFLEDLVIEFITDMVFSSFLFFFLFLILFCLYYFIVYLSYIFQRTDS